MPVAQGCGMQLRQETGAASLAWLTKEENSELRTGGGTAPTHSTATYMEMHLKSG